MSLAKMTCLNGNNICDPPWISLGEGDEVASLGWYGTGLAGNTKGGSITAPLTSCLTGLEYDK